MAIVGCGVSGGVDWVSTEKTPSDRKKKRTAVSKFINSVSRSVLCASGCDLYLFRHIRGGE
jgi:hypothetical protein